MRILAALSALCLIGFVGGVADAIWPQRADVAADLARVFASPAPAGTALATAAAPARPVYRHSIVPGGAYSSGDVADAMRNDPVVAAHYEHVDIDKVHPKTVTTTRAVYVSYRVGDQVFWTKNRVRLSPGETLLTDGATEIRARCGNLVSDHAQQPVAAEELPVAALDETQPDTGSSTMAGVREPEAALDDVPHVPLSANNVGSGGATLPPGTPGLTPPMSAGGGTGGAPSTLGSHAGSAGPSTVTPLGSSGRPGRGASAGDSNDQNGGGNGNNGSNGAGSNDQNGDGNGNNGKNDGNGSNGSNEGGSNGGGSNGGGSNGANPPVDPSDVTTTGDVTPTTGDVVFDTSGETGTDGSAPSVPEPATLLLFGAGAIGAAARRLRSRR